MEIVYYDFINFNYFHKQGDVKRSQSRDEKSSVSIRQALAAKCFQRYISNLRSFILWKIKSFFIQYRFGKRSDINEWIPFGGKWESRKAITTSVEKNLIVVLIRTSSIFVQRNLLCSMFDVIIRQYHSMQIAYLDEYTIKN